MKKRPPVPQMGELFAFPSEPEKVESFSTQLPDRYEREQALDVTRSWIVEAPAGSGKTGLLIQRYLKILAHPTVEQPEQVLAITFTLKATGEIRERVLEQLERAAHPDSTTQEFERETRALASAVLERDRSLGWGILEHPYRLNVRTIDSVCAEIARNLPVLSGNGALSPIENASPLHQLAAERTLLQLGGSDVALSEALQLILLHRDGNLAQVRDLLAEMLSLRDQWARLVPLGRQMLEDEYLDREVLPQIERSLADAICLELEDLARLMPAPALRNLAILAGELGRLEGYNNQPSPITACADLYHVPKIAIEDLDRWRALTHLLVKPSGGWRSGFSPKYLQFMIESEQIARLREIVDQLRDKDDLLKALEGVTSLPPTKYPEEQWRIAKALFRVLYRALAELQIVFAEYGECDFTELGLIARATLSNENTALESIMGMRLQHILVDEMQDTSTSQYELIQLLTQGWDGHSQTVFLVGDPKQSIYLFRQARVERFLQTMRQRRLGELELGALYLTANFRSQRNLVNAFNAEFMQLFPKEIKEDPSEAPYVAAEPVRKASEEVTQSITWHTQISPSGSLPEEKRRLRRRVAKREALEIRRIIEQWRSRPLPEGRTAPWKIAVLVRNRVHLTEIVAELKQVRNTASIPFRAVNIESLDERPEILDLFALTRALLHPADRVAWLAILRAPWCGLELSELHALMGEDQTSASEKTIEELLQENGQNLTEEGCARISRIWPVLQAAMAQHSRLPLAEWVERTWRSLGGDAGLSQEQKANARRYFELLDDLEKQGSFDLAQLRFRLKSLYAESLSVPGAVDLMTIHGAKGLEWDVVLVPGLEKRNRTSRGRLLTWSEVPSQDEHAAQVLLAPITGKGRDSETLNRWLNRLQRSREDAECRRLFYVACTRAREELHLFASPQQNQNGEIRQNPGSLLQAVWPVAEKYFVDIQTGSKPLIAPVIPVPVNDSLILPSLAAETEEPRKAILHRLPLSFAPSNRLQPGMKEAEIITPLPVTGRFDRPEGSFEARALGNAVHIFLELLANQFAAGVSPQALLNQIVDWTPRIIAVLRNSGISPQSLERMSTSVKFALENTLRDPAGLWVLNAHSESYSERPFVMWEQERTNLRLDRIFRAGAKPFAPGGEYLWIIDYKTTQTSGLSEMEFFAREREKYAQQMMAYAHTMLSTIEADRVRLGLYFPMLPGLTWWPLSQ